MSSIHSSLLPTHAPSLAIPMVEQLPLITNLFRILSKPSSVDFTILCFQSCYSHNTLAKLAVIFTLLNLPTTQYVRSNASSFNSLIKARQPPWPWMICTSNTSVLPIPCLMMPVNGMLHYHQSSLMLLPPNFKHTYARVLICILNQSSTPLLQSSVRNLHSCSYTNSQSKPLWPCLPGTTKWRLHLNPCFNTNFQTPTLVPCLPLVDPKTHLLKLQFGNVKIFNPMKTSHLSFSKANPTHLVN